MEALLSPVRFARHALDNLQSVIRFQDTKAGALTALVLLIGGVGYEHFQQGLGSLTFAPSPLLYWLEDLVFSVAWAVFWLAAVATLVRLLFLVVLPRSATHYAQPTKTRDLLFWGHILLHDSNESYYAAVQNVDEKVELRNVTDQVYELAHIVDAKVKALQEMRTYLIVVVISWLVGTGAAVLIRLRG